MVKAVFFDFFKTLSVFRAQSFEANLRKIAERYRVEINWECYDASIEHYFIDIPVSNAATHSVLEWLMTTMRRECEFVRALGIQEHVEQIAWELLQLGSPFFAATNAKLYDDVIPTLHRLHDAGFKLAIVSNWITPLDPLTEQLGIAAYFELIVASHDVRVMSMKPDPAIFNYALAGVNVSAEEVVYVGDTYETDIIGARNVGIRPILLDRDNAQTGRLDETIRSLTELLELLT